MLQHAPNCISRPQATRQSFTQHAPGRLVRLRRSVCVTASAAVDEQAPTSAVVKGLRLNLSADTMLTVPLSVDKGMSLKKAITTLVETLAAKAKATRPQRWPMMEWNLQERGAPATSDELEQLEVICNPNACSTIFEARALVTLRTKGGLKLTAEARIPSLQADLDAYLSQ